MMGRRQGTVDDRVLVAVSKSMADLRRTLGVLNGFWQTSELAYGYLLTHSTTDTEFADPNRPTIKVLGYIQSEVWYPNNQGRIKLSDTIGTTLQQVRDNTVHVYRAALLSFFSAFEAYLDTEVDHLKPSNVSWGQYVRSLSNTSLRSAECPLPLRTVLCADVAARSAIGWCMSHPQCQRRLADSFLIDWKKDLYDRACEFGWPQSEVTAGLSYAFDRVIGQAVNHVEEARKDGKRLPIELFYMLFSFTNLDSLAFAIEEALQPPGARPGGQVSRKQAAVRRGDLIIGPAV